MQYERLNLKMGNSGGRHNAGRRWGQVFRRRREMHNTMLVFNMSIFNFGGGWNRILGPLETRSRN